MIFLLFALIGFFIHWAVKRKDGLDLLLLYLVFFCFGLYGIFNFLADVVYPSVPAQVMGWQPGNPFEFETGIANLSLGVLGLLSVRFRGGFLLAALIGNTIWFIGDAIGHFIGTGRGNDFFYWGDAIIPILIWIVYFLSPSKQS